jgi:hypothetical protein
MVGEDPDPKKIYGPKGGKLIEEVVMTYKKPSPLSFMGISNMNAFHASQDRYAMAIRGSKAALATEKFEKNLAFAMGTFGMGGSNLLASAGWATLDTYMSYQDEKTQGAVGKVQLAAILLVIARKGNGIQNLADDIVALNRTTNGGGVLLNSTPASAISSAMYYEAAEEQAASIFKSISHGHMFMDGNKRTAVAVFEKLSKAAGLQTTSKQEMLNVATEVTEGKLTDVSEIAKRLTK